MRRDVDTRKYRVVGDERVRYHEIAGNRGRKGDPAVQEVANDAADDLELCSGVERDAGGAGDADPVERYVVYGNLVAGAGIDGDGRSVSWWCYVGPALSLDGDGLADGERAVGARVERIDLAARGGRGHCGLKRPAGP